MNEGGRKKGRRKVSSDSRKERTKDVQDGTDDEGDHGAATVTDGEVDLVLKLERHSVEEEEKGKANHQHVVRRLKSSESNALALHQRVHLRSEARRKRRTLPRPQPLVSQNRLLKVLPLLLILLTLGHESVALCDRLGVDLAFLEGGFESFRGRRNVRFGAAGGEFALVRVGATGEVVGGGLTGEIGVTERHLQEKRR
jgi:hypothetical protein